MADEPIAPAPAEDSLESIAELRNRYLDLLIGALTHTLYMPIDTRPLPEEVQQAIREELERTGEPLELRTPWEERAQGRDRPVYGQSMIGLERMGQPPGVCRDRLGRGGDRRLR